MTKGVGAWLSFGFPVSNDAGLGLYLTVYCYFVAAQRIVTRPTLSDQNRFCYTCRTTPRSFKFLLATMLLV